MKALLRRTRSYPAIEVLETRIAPAAHTWIGSSGGLWNVGANWTNGVPTTGEVGGTILIFNGASLSVDNIPGLIVDQIVFNAGGNTIQGSNGATLGLNGTVASDDILNVAGTSIIDSTLPLVTAGIATINVNVEAGKLTIESNVSGTTGMRLLSTSGSGILTYAGTNNTYAGVTLVSSGTLELNCSGTSIPGSLSVGQSGLGETAVVKLLGNDQIANASEVDVQETGIFNLNNFNESIGKLDLFIDSTSAGVIATGTGTLTLLDDVRIIGNAGPAATISGKITLATGDHDFSVPKGLTATISATISGAGGLTKSGPGTLRLTSGTANTFTGDTIVADGVLELDGATSDILSENIIVGDGLGLGRSAVLVLGQLLEIANTASVTVRRDGLFDTASFAETIGALTVESGGAVDVGTANLSTTGASFAPGSFFDQSGAGKVIVAGALSLGGRPGIPHSFAPALNTTVTIMTNDLADAVTGTFDNLPEGAFIGSPFGLYQVSYVGGDGNDVTLTFVDGEGVLTIAPNGKSATYTDIDGDRVTIKTSKGDLNTANFEFGSTGAGINHGYQLQKVVITDAAFTNAVISITAKPSVNGGNGRVNVGGLEVYRDVASILVAGDLGRFSLGDPTPDVQGIGKLTVDSMGEYGSSTQRAAMNNQSSSAVGIGSLVVKGNVRGGDFNLGKAGSVNIGGSLIGVSGFGGRLTVSQAKSIVVKGSIIVPSGIALGSIFSFGDVGSISVGHDVVGSSVMTIGGKLGSLAVKGAVIGQTSPFPASITALGSDTAPTKGADVAIGRITIGLSAENFVIRAGYNIGLAAENVDAVIGKISIGGDFRASSIIVGASPGADGVLATLDDEKAVASRDVPLRFSTIASLIIKGQAIGTTAAGDSYGIVAERIGSAKIGGTALKLKTGARNPEDTFALGFASAGLGLPSDFYLHEISI